MLKKIIILLCYNRNEEKVSNRWFAFFFGTRCIYCKKKLASQPQAI